MERIYAGIPCEKEGEQVHRDIGINPDFDCLLDPQMANVCCFCEQCGGEIYKSGERLCGECQEVE